MIYKFVDDKATFRVSDSNKYNCYFPLVDKDGKLLSSISPNLAGDIKQDNDHFLTPPTSIIDIKSNLLCRREFFIKTKGETLRLSYPSRKDVLEAGFLYHKIIKDYKSLSAQITNFIPYNTACEVMQVKIINKSNKNQEILPTSFIPLYGRSEKNLRDHRHVSSLLNRISLDKYGIILEPSMVFNEKGHTLNRSCYFVFGYEGNGSVIAGQFPTLEYFYGTGDLVCPDAIEKNVRPVREKPAGADGKEVCAAFRFAKKTLKAKAEVNYYLVMGIEEDKRLIKRKFLRLNSAKKVESSFKETKKYWLDLVSQTDFCFGDKDFDNWLAWVKLQPVLRKLFGCSFLAHFDYGKGGRGWRDLWQDALSLALTDSKKTKELILKNFAGVRIDGSNATIITSFGKFISDRNRISRVWMDHGIWPYLTTRLYLHKTGDLKILLEQTSYFRDCLLKRAKEIDPDFKQKDYLLRTAAGRVYKASILEHILVENLVQFFNVGEHNIIRLENADWNDGLDMAPDRGESAAFSFMYAHNLKDLCNFLEKLSKQTKYVYFFKELALLLDRLNKPVNYSDFRAKQKRLDEYLNKTKNIGGKKIKVEISDLISDLNAKSEHLFSWLGKNEWLNKCGFFNGYYDNSGKRVEGKVSKKIRMLLPSQVFAITSGGASRPQIEKIWDSIQKYLKDKKLSGFRLNTRFSSVYLDLGRAFGFSYGDKENGAFFNHMAVMLANGLYKRGFIKEGFQVLDSVYKMARSQKAEIYPMIPEYFNNDGKGLYLYLTGSASWYIYTLMEQILGIKFNFGDIVFEPKLTDGNFFNRRISAKFNFGQKRVNIFYERTDNKKIYETKRVFLGKEQIRKGPSGYIIKKQDLKNKVNNIRVYF